MNKQDQWQICDLEWSNPDVDAGDPKALAEWLEGQAAQLGARWLLAFADDGVIWGVMDGENLALSGGVYPEISPALEPLTLQELRLFGKDAELLVWRAQGGLQARALREVAGEGVKYRQYDLLLWGAAAGAPKDGFQLMEEGAQGLRHAPPARAARARLKARDYLAHDEKTGQAYICCSRLVLLEEGGA